MIAAESFVFAAEKGRVDEAVPVSSTLVNLSSKETSNDKRTDLSPRRISEEFNTSDLRQKGRFKKRIDQATKRAGAYLQQAIQDRL